MHWPLSEMHLKPSAKDSSPSQDQLLVFETDVNLVVYHSPGTYRRGVGYPLWQEERCKAENPNGCEKYV